MTCYLFVPGGKRRKEDWDQVRAILESQGRQTNAITLSDPEYSSLSNHITEVCNLIDKATLQNVYLIGHSYAGFVITGVANKIPQKIARLIYLDSAIPENGQSLFDVFRTVGIDPGQFGVPGWPPFTERLFFDSAVIRKIPKMYVHCLNSQFLDLTKNIPLLFSKHENDNYWDYTKTGEANWTYCELKADHYCMLNASKELAGIIQEAPPPK
ncbi:MAG TPA: alpha/beta hydrolase [Smithellaceae bacterium]|nr:alpha/beta hydrolase [Smithellaceae bacterium]